MFENITVLLIAGFGPIARTDGESQTRHRSYAFSNTMGRCISHDERDEPPPNVILSED
jgi:hypothetical protein